MKKICLTHLFVMLAVVTYGEYPSLSWVYANISTAHPRLYLTPQKVAQLRSGMDANQTAFLAKVKTNADSATQPSVKASCAALYYLLTGNTAYRDQARTYLLNNAVPNDYYYFLAFHYICAFDWLYNDLSPADRTSIGAKLVTFGNGELLSDRITVTESFYSPRANLFWLGVTLYNTGINDVQTSSFVGAGYNDFCQLFTYRQSISSDDGGGSGDLTIEYALGSGAPAQGSMTDFLYIWRSAIRNGFHGAHLQLPTHEQFHPVEHDRVHPARSRQRV